jgi:predicted negative regulator of RcsB-dependent stress response
MGDVLTLYSAIRHGCLAGNIPTAFAVLRDRLWRPQRKEESFYPTRFLGLSASDLVAMSSFFSDRKFSPRPELEESDQLKLLTEAGVRLRNVGRMKESLAVIQNVLRSYATIPAENLEQNAALRADICYAKMTYCELLILRGDYAAAARNAEAAITLADSTDNMHFKIQARTCAAEVALYLDDFKTAKKLFEQAKAIEENEANGRANHELCYSQSLSRFAKYAALSGDHLTTIFGRASLSNWGGTRKGSDLAIAIDFYAEAICSVRSLRDATLESEQRALRTRAAKAFHEANLAFRKAGYSDYLTRLLLEKARFESDCGKFAEAEKDLQEAEIEISKGDMSLFTPELEFVRGHFQLAKGDTAAARRTFTKVASMDTDGHHLFARMATEAVTALPS